MVDVSLCSRFVLSECTIWGYNIGIEGENISYFV